MKPILKNLNQILKTATPKKEVIDLLSKPVKGNLTDQTIKRLRKSQLLFGEKCGVIGIEGSWLFIRTEDGTLGWTPKENIDEVQEVFNVNLSPKSTVFETKKIDLREIKDFEGIPYVWGGRSSRGFDCSGFVQFVFKSFFDISLPKHSWDMRPYGTQVEINDLEPLDIIFLLKKNDAGKHIGIYLGEGKFIHAAKAKDGVNVEDFKEVLKRYDLVEARRLLK
ncbi:hypothetical protein AUK11_03650 [bacterium CG2_30_37_16]|nr:MAG: hypothetical protein AUK11_03650 [bacterium CG2_30_37_16]PIP30486.1 MAG: hypothetical protein COX25_04450 [bacterium (Candidatus Howlettbacteria) CG23_combo_of_CG06-09_8_20_14_all_37_9]PJB06008.1 MAG: hypothetical protein CO123_02985 [bacterium (Candidatus Howlettbacteria) CG_4_9_14_3_um_filter_37_10]